MSRVLNTTAAGALVALVATIGMTAPSFAKAKKGMSSHHAGMSKGHRSRRMASKSGAYKLPTATGNGLASPFNDGDIIGGNGSVAPRATYPSPYAGGGYSSNGGVLGTGVLGGQGALGLGILGL